MSNQSIKTLIKRLWPHIKPLRRRQFGFLLVLMLLASFAEIFTIGAVLPFLGVLIAPEQIFEHDVAQPIIQTLGLSTPEQLLLPLTIIFSFTILFSGTVRLFLLWASTRLSFATGADLSASIYRRTLHQPYSVHCARNSSEVINGVTRKADSIIFNIIFPSLTLISSSIMLIFVLITLLIIEPGIALSVFGGFSLIYILIIRLTRKKLMADSKLIARESSQVIKSLQEGLGGIRDVLIDGSQAVFCQIYRNADLPLRRAQGNNIFISSSPRYAMEVFGMLLITGLAYNLAQVDGLTKAIPTLGVLTFGAQRLLPVLQQAYAAWSSIRGGQSSLQDSLELIEQPLPNDFNQLGPKVLPFKFNITLKQVGFRYSSQSPYILQHINLTIAKGSRIGIIGTTGSGKSTLIDILMALLQPTDGLLEVDGKAINSLNHRDWQSQIAHVPQAIFLADGSIEENIAFGIPKDQIDHDKVRKAAQNAQISNSIEALPKKYQTLVGERGINLSGGQRQRIGIARALYKEANVIIFDEATSALDEATEMAVMQSIGSLSKNLTLLIVSHRVTTLKNCDQIVELAELGIKRMGCYQDIIYSEK